jgi:ribonuclease P protein component
MNTRFQKSERLVKRKEFQVVFDGGRKFRNNELLVFALPNGMDKSRLGLVVGKKVGNAVRRNRIKRILREAFRLNKGLLNPHIDLILIPRPGLKSPALSIIEDGFKKLLSRISEEFKG